MEYRKTNSICIYNEPSLEGNNKWTNGKALHQGLQYHDCNSAHHINCRREFSKNNKTYATRHLNQLIQQRICEMFVFKCDRLHFNCNPICANRFGSLTNVCRFCTFVYLCLLLKQTDRFGCVQESMDCAYQISQFWVQCCWDEQKTRERGTSGPEVILP